jgi:hypothetical protein
MLSMKYETLHGACPERDSSVASLLQNDRKRRVQGDNFETFARASDTLIMRIFYLYQKIIAIIFLSVILYNCR